MNKQKTILIVDDEKSIRDPIVDVLKQNDFLTLEATNGKEAVEVALDKHPDLILLDIIMPVMDGMVAFKKIREDKWGRKVPVIILTNLSATEEKMIHDMVECKPLHYLIKSDWSLAEIIKQVKKGLAV
ncbi:MAG: response regulator [Candidatus Vogelbacteria bacterium]|nr:response regulator [Candidatus Vogelbacteria bacterium]